MSIENDLGRIAHALERSADAMEQIVVLATKTNEQTDIVYKGAASDVEVVATIKEVAPEVPTAPKRRGRPPKQTQTEAQAPTDATETKPAQTEAREAAPAESVASFLDDTSTTPEPPAVATIEGVRQALSDLVTRIGGDAGKAAAYKVLKSVGAEYLPGSPKDRELGGNAPGALKADKFADVIAAAKKA